MPSEKLAEEQSSTMIEAGEEFRKGKERVEGTQQLLPAFQYRQAGSTAHVPVRAWQ